MTVLPIVTSGLSGPSAHGLHTLRDKAECPARTVFLDKYGPTPTEPTGALAVGIYLHKYMEYYYNALMQGASYLDTVAMPITDHAGHPVDSSERREAETMFRDYQLWVHKDSKHFGRITHVEYEVGSSVLDVTARLDLVIRITSKQLAKLNLHVLGGTPEPGDYIVDHKTDNKRRPERYAAWAVDPQFQIQQLCWNEGHPRSRRAKGTIVNVLYKDKTFERVFIPPITESQGLMVKKYISYLRIKARLAYGSFGFLPAHNLGRCYAWENTCEFINRCTRGA